MHQLAGRVAFVPADVTDVLAFVTLDQFAGDHLDVRRMIVLACFEEDSLRLLLVLEGDSVVFDLEVVSEGDHSCHGLLLKNLFSDLVLALGCQLPAFFLEDGFDCAFR